jgi:hypothetical protein
VAWRLAAGAPSGRRGMTGARGVRFDSARPGTALQIVRLADTITVCIRKVTMPKCARRRANR